MGRKYKFHDNERLYFVTFTIIHWIDIFIRRQFRDIFYESVAFCQKNKGLQVYAYCIMTSHIHLIIGTHKNPLSDIVRDLKAFTSRKIKIEMDAGTFESRKDWIMRMCRSAGIYNKNNIDFQLWVQNNHPIQLDSNYMMDQKLDYIHNNPVEAGFVEKPEDWLHSSAADYYEIRKGFMDIIKIN